MLNLAIVSAKSLVTVCDEEEVILLLVKVIAQAK